jgi:predicted metal-dependent phosphoesterase TrpH
VSEPRIDLHTHTTASDGSDTPRQLVEAAAGVVDMIGLTDHDTTAGWPEAGDQARISGVAVVPGIELSAQIIDPGSGEPPLSVHLLGYLIDPLSLALQAELAKIRSHRDDRLRLMVERLSRDLDISWEEVAERMPPGATPGRPHIADVLVTKGLVGSVTEAFDHYLASHGPYHVPHYAPRLHTALATIRAAGGVPILAHPLSGGRRYALASMGDPSALLRELRELEDAGLAGVEVHHRENAPHLTDQLEHAVGQLGMIRTGSSDYHGSKKPNRLGEHLTQMSEWEKIVQQATGSSPILPASWPG